MPPSAAMPPSTTAGGSKLPSPAKSAAGAKPGSAKLPFRQYSLSSLRARPVYPISAMTPVPEDPGVERGLISLLGWTCQAGLADARDPEISFGEWGDCLRRQLDHDRLGIEVRLEPSDAAAEQPVVQLGANPSGINLEAGFFTGRVRIFRASGLEVVEEFIHDDQSDLRSQLPPDTSELRRGVQREGWARADQPAERMTLKVDQGLQTLPNAEVAVNAVVLASRDSTVPMPEGYEREILTPVDENAVLHSPLRTSLPRSQRQLQPSWSIQAGVLQPKAGPDLGAAQRGEGLELERLWPVVRWRR